MTKGVLFVNFKPENLQESTSMSTLHYHENSEHRNDILSRALTFLSICLANKV